MFWGLLSLCAYVRYAQRRRYRWLAVSLVCFTCSLASKQTFVTLPCLLLLMDFWPLGRMGRALVQPDQPGPSRRRRARALLLVEKIPYLALSAAFCAVVLFSQSQGHAVRSLTEMPPTIRMFNAILAYGLYLEKTVVPFDLAIFYPHPGTEIGLRSVAITGVVLAAISVFAVATWRRWPFVFVGWFWFLGTLVPMIGLVQVGLQQRADRYTYFPNLGLYLAIAWLLPAMVPAAALRRRALPAVACGAVAVYAVIAFVQVGYWRDGIVLMRHCLAVTDETPFTRTVMGDAFFTESRVKEAFEQYRRVVELAPRDPNSYVTLGVFYYHLNRFETAADQFRLALKLDERYAAAHTGLALAHCGQQHYVEARREFFRGLAIQDRDAGAYAGLALMCRILGEIPQSIAYAERALEIDHTPVFSQRLKAIKLFDQGRLDEAIDCWQGLLAVQPGNERVRAELEQAQALRQKRAEAAQRNAQEVARAQTTRT
jgi:tetratricopeptide (TPR) repeat protein